MGDFNPAEFGKRLRKAVTKHDDSYKILDSHPTAAGSSWQAGGCLMLADALNKHLGPRSKKMDVVNHKTGHTDHVVVQHGDHIYDGDGATKASHFIRTYKRRESYSGDATLSLQPHDKERAQKSGIVSSDEVSSKMHAHLKKHAPLKPVPRNESVSDVIRRVAVNENKDS